MRKRTLVILAILSILIPYTTLGAEAPSSVHIEGRETIIVGYFDCWLHADGGTWQDTDHDGVRDVPGDGKTKETDLVVSVPEDLKTQYENVTYKVIPFDSSLTPGQMSAMFTQGGGYFSGVVKPNEPPAECINFDIFFMKILKYRPENYQLKVGTTNRVNLVFPYDKDNTLDIKRTDQAQLVQGRRKLLPALVQFYGIPKPVDIEAVAIDRQNPVLVNTSQVSTAVFKNNGTSAATFTAQYYACSQLVGSESLEIQAGETRTRNFSWQSPGTPGTYKLKIHAVPLEGEANVENNTKEINVTVQNPNYAKPDCEFTSKQTANWDELYVWYVPYDCSWTDEDGNDHPATCYEEYQETVRYNESLSVDVAINTKQGIATDRDHPQESDRESRGSWEIIPWAKKNGLDPNEVTRAGYGFEVKVQTTYWTDWETKVPGGASPHGGEYQGPSRVMAQFYDTANRFVEQAELEPTRGKAGDKSITWELPVKTHTFPDGIRVHERKHYTDVHNQDGHYTVRIIVFDCGREPLSICRDKTVTIYGDMYDDIYTRISIQDEAGY